MPGRAVFQSVFKFNGAGCFGRRRMPYHKIAQIVCCDAMPGFFGQAMRIHSGFRFTPVSLICFEGLLKAMAALTLPIAKGAAGMTSG